MFWEFLFSCSFSSFSCSFWKFQNEHQIWGKLKEKEKLAELLLFHADSLTLVEVDNQHKTAANCYFLNPQGLQGSSQQCQQTNWLNCWLVTSPSTWLAWFANFSRMDTVTLPDCQVRWSHSIQTFKSTCTFCWSLCSWINNVDDFFQKHSMSFTSESCFRPQEQENKENALNHASSFSCRRRNTWNMVQKEWKTSKRGIPQKKMQPSFQIHTDDGHC